MRTAEEIMAGAKPMIDRMSDGLKVVGSGNTAGLVGMIAALNTVPPDHAHTVILLKPTAIIFAVGIFLFAGGYLFLMYSYIYLENYLAILQPNDSSTSDEQRIAQSEPPKAASISYMRWSLILGLASTFVFFLGFVVAFVGLVRY
jgi:drug/metabolite transporter (DMT)-like permease